MGVEKRLFVSSQEKNIERETKRCIRKIMSVIETYTDYDDLELIKKSLVRDTVLNQINKLVRVTKTINTIVFEDKE